MKKKLLLALLLLAGILSGNVHAQAPDWGAADTVASHMVGPGIEYTKIIYRSRPLILWYTVIDLTNPYNKIEQVQSRHSIPDVKRWDVMTHYKENSRPGHNVKLAWNHDFFSYDAGICIGMNISEGEITWNKWGRSLLAITKNKTAEVFWPNNIETKVISPDNTEVGIDMFNARAEGIEGDCVLFNRLNATTLSEAGRYIKLKPLAEWTVNGADIPCEVLEISGSPIQTTKTEYVLFLRGSKLTALDGHINVGDQLKVYQKFNGAKWGTPPADIVNAFHGYPSLAHDGKLHDGEYNDFEGGREYENSSHVLVGISQDKTKVYVLINEMSANSVEVNCVDLTNWMLERGAWDIVNFDSGGSAAIVMDGEMLNLPGRGSVRPVQDAMLAVSLAPEDNDIDHYTFSRPYINPSTISLTPLRVLSFNQYSEVLESDVKDCTFTCEPQDMGYVDSEGVFHSSAKATGGKIIAEKNGKRAEIKVVTRHSGVISPRFSNILLDGNREYLVEVLGKTDRETFTLDPSAFQWASSNPDVCVVEDGIMTGKNEGNAVMTATFEDISFDINVVVEKVEGNRQHLNFENLEELGASYSGIKNMAVDLSKRPEGWTDGATYRFDVSSSRSPYFKFVNPVKLYSLPDSVSFQLDNSSAIIKSVNIQYEDNLGGKSTVSFDAPAKDSIYVFRFLEKDNSVFAVGKYPVTIKNIQFNVQNAKIGTGYEIALRNLVAYYPGESSVGTVISGKKDNKLRISVGAETVKVMFDATRAGKNTVSMYSTTGTLIYKGLVDVAEGNNEIEINTKEASCGFYIISVSGPQGVKSGKCVIK